MTENVILTIGGEQMDLGEDASTEMITVADYYNRNGKHFILYDETDPESGAHTGNTIKIADSRVDVIRRGAGNVHMVFEKGKQHMSSYHTPAGQLMMDIQTTDICTKETPALIETDIDYTLHMNGVYISKCRVKIRIMAKETAKLHIG